MTVTADRVNQDEHADRDDLSPEEKLDYIHALWARFTADPRMFPSPSGTTR